MNTGGFLPRGFSNIEFQVLFTSLRDPREIIWFWKKWLFSCGFNSVSRPSEIALISARVYSSFHGFNAFILDPPLFSWTSQSDSIFQQPTDCFFRFSKCQGFSILFVLHFLSSKKQSISRFHILKLPSTQNTLRNSLNFSCFWFFLRAHLRNAIRFSFQIQMIHISVSSLNSENLFSFFIRFSILNHKEFFLCNFLYLLCFIRSHIAPKLRTSPFFAVSHDFFVW